MRSGYPRTQRRGRVQSCDADISDEPCFWLDLEGSVVNGDCYWMVAQDGKDDLLWLAAGVGN